jgi:myo-inositol-hexaphosphate 3-phosphohydrolase
MRTIAKPTGGAAARDHQQNGRGWIMTFKDHGTASARLAAGALLLAAGLISVPASAGDWSVAEVAPTLQTAALAEADGDANADDPAIYVAADPAKCFVAAAVKEGGIRVYGLDGTLKQTIAPAEDGRINNVDIVYGFAMGDGSTADLVIASDRGLDIIRIYKVDAGAAEPLTEVTDPAAGRAFPQRPNRDTGAAEDNPLDDQNTVYGLAAWNDKASGKAYVVGTLRHQPVVGIFTLAARPDGHVAAVFDHDFRVPAEHKGQSLWQENDDDVLLDFSPQFEGIAIDQTDGTIYAGEEDVGIWAVPVTGGEPKLDYETRGSSKSSFNNPDSVIARDVEGISIYYGDGVKYLIASSQGSAHGDKHTPDAPYDDSFALFAIDNGLKLVGSFRVAARGDIDTVQESDGADVSSVALPGFPNGVFITQDGYAGDLNGLSGEPTMTNFKFVDWAEVAKAVSSEVKVTPGGWNPRQ